MRLHNVKWTVGVAVVLAAASCGLGAVTVDKMFSDHMVLQRQMPVPVWGTAAAGEKSLNVDDA